YREPRSLLDPCDTRLTFPLIKLTRRRSNIRERSLPAQPGVSSQVTACTIYWETPIGRGGFECLLQHKLMAWTERPSMSRKRATAHLKEQRQSVLWIVFWCQRAIGTLPQSFQKLKRNRSRRAVYRLPYCRR